MFDDAVAHLKRVDAPLGAIIDRVGRQPPGPRTEGTHLGAIARAIVYQQLSGKAAGTIHGRFLALFGGRDPSAEELLATRHEDLRSVGLSKAKSLYLKDLAAKIVSGALPIDDLHTLSDEDLLEALTAVKGIGRWTAQMFLLFRLGRPNILPDLDLGVRKGVQLVYRLKRLPTPKEVLARGAIWSPFASVASWYLWRSLELKDETGTAGTRDTRSSATRRRLSTAKRPRANRPVKGRRKRAGSTGAVGKSRRPAKRGGAKKQRRTVRGAAGASARRRGKR